MTYHFFANCVHHPTHVQANFKAYHVFTQCICYTSNSLRFEPENILEQPYEWQVCSVQTPKSFSALAPLHHAVSR